MTATKTRSFDLELKSIKDDGSFTGYAWVWGVVDSYREMVMPGAFAASLAATKDKGRAIPILWQHRSDEPIGQWDMLREDERGLYGEGTLWTEEAPYARIAHRGMTAHAITGISIGYYTRQDSFDEKTRIRSLQVVDLIEASVVTNPANDEARVDSIKAKLAAGERISTGDFERILSERGFSRADADAIASVGFKAWAERGPAPSNHPGDLGELVKSLRTPLSLPRF